MIELLPYAGRFPSITSDPYNKVTRGHNPQVKGLSQVSCVGSKAINPARVEQYRAQSLGDLKAMTVCNKQVTCCL